MTRLTLRGWAGLRDERLRAAVAQAVVAVLLLAALAWLARAVQAEFAARGLTPGLDFLGNEAGFQISEGAPFADDDTYWRAFRVGLGNTLRAAIAGIVLATPLGVLVALGRLSGNPLVVRLSAGYVELFRNTPLLVQLIFWYQGVFTRLPAIQEAIVLRPAFGAPDVAVGAGGVWLALSQKGLALPRPVPTDAAVAWGGAILVGAALTWFLVSLAGRRGGSVRRLAPWVLGALWLAFAAATWRVAPPPIVLDLPQLSRFRYTGGLHLSPEFAALLTGLVAYTAAFVAEVVRGGIRSVSTGQREAARALGLTETKAMRHVVLPQALRVIVPPLTNQYLNLSKNSSLAIYTGFPDLFNISLTIGNQTGQFVVLTAMIMAVYLGISLITSLAMSAYGRRIRLVER